MNSKLQIFNRKSEKKLSPKRVDFKTYNFEVFIKEFDFLILSEVISTGTSFSIENSRKHTDCFYFIVTGIHDKIS